MGLVTQGPRRGDVYLVELNPTRGQEIRKTRPCVVVSPDELNQHLTTLLIAPLTRGGHRYPFRIPCRFQKRQGHIVLDQIRAVDAGRLLQRLGRISPTTLSSTLGTLQEMFAE
ncbi:MAG: type II toxin-antitoxin system PemK/MazF family toxin [Wenzhouxiangella sp.]|nr:MAG: type II toxin-antitoxin system PemK/MazF family toxin [Wenzhouxiangella sp.]